MNPCWSDFFMMPGQDGMSSNILRFFWKLDPTGRVPVPRRSFGKICLKIPMIYYVLGDNFDPCPRFIPLTSSEKRRLDEILHELIFKEDLEVCWSVSIVSHGPHGRQNDKFTCLHSFDCLVTPTPGVSRASSSSSSSSSPPKNSYPLEI